MHQHRVLKEHEGPIPPCWQCGEELPKFWVRAESNSPDIQSSGAWEIETSSSRGTYKHKIWFGKWGYNGCMYFCSNVCAVEFAIRAAKALEEKHNKTQS